LIRRMSRGSYKDTARQSALGPRSDQSGSTISERPSTTRWTCSFFCLHSPLALRLSLSPQPPAQHTCEQTHSLPVFMVTRDTTRLASACAFQGIQAALLRYLSWWPIRPVLMLGCLSSWRSVGLSLCFYRALLVNQAVIIYRPLC